MGISSDVTKASEFVLVYEGTVCHVCQENIYQETTCPDNYTLEVFTNQEDIDARVVELNLTPAYSSPYEA